VSDELKEIRIQAETFAREHVVECAVELLEWSNTSLLRDGRVRELAKMLQQLDEHHSLTLAERFATRAALERAVQPAPTEEMIRFCPECGCLGDIQAGYHACCPDSSHARVVPKRFAELCRDTFKLCVSQPYPPAQTERALTDDARDAARYRWMRDFNVRCKDGVEVMPPCEHVFASIYEHAVGTIPTTRLVTGEELDRAIDAALTAAQPANGDTEPPC
jgi:hypothetical protein